MDVINDVLLSELVVREGRAVQVIEGPKTFSGGLVVHGASNTTLLNGVDVVAMNRSLLRLDQPLIINTRVVRSVGNGKEGGTEWTGKEGKERKGRERRREKRWEVKGKELRRLGIVLGVERREV